MGIIYSVLVLLSSWIWVDYFRLIASDEMKKMGYQVLTFVLGLLSCLLFYKICYPFFNDHMFRFESKTLDHFLSSVLTDGFVGEFFKMVPVLIIYKIFRKQLNEPLHLLMLFSITALGFSAMKNLVYLSAYPYFVFNDKVILTTLGEMFITSIFAHGMIAHLFYHKTKKPSRLFIYFILASIFHGFYDFWLDYERTVNYGFIVTIIYFFIMISMFSVTLTNSFNFSSDFTYKTINGTKAISKIIFRYYIGLLGIQFFILSFNVGFLAAIENLADTIWFAGLIVFVAVHKLNNIKTIKGRWDKLKVEMPFMIYKIDSFNGRATKYRLKFRGETFKEYLLDQYFDEPCSIYPLSSRNTYIVHSKTVLLEEKVFLKNDETFYLAKVLNVDKDEYFLLKPKNSGKKTVKRKYAIVGLFSILDLEDVKNKNLSATDFQFREWVFVKHR